MRDEVRLLLARHRPGLSAGRARPGRGTLRCRRHRRRLYRPCRGAPTCEGRRARSSCWRRNGSAGAHPGAMADTSTTASPTAILAAKAELGKERAIALYRAFDNSIDTIEALIAEEGIDCNFRRAGKLKLASKPQHFDAIARNFEAIHAEVDPDTALLSARRSEARDRLALPRRDAVEEKRDDAYGPLCRGPRHGRRPPRCRHLRERGGDRPQAGRRQASAHDRARHGHRRQRAGRDRRLYAAESSAISAAASSPSAASSSPRGR